MKPNEHLLIFGASTRAAAFSALRAGLRPWCADLFADQDQRRRCPALAVPRAAYPHAFETFAERLAPPGPWMYTGGLENHPRLVARISRTRRLWGNGADSLRGSRDPGLLRAAVQAAGLSMPDTREGQEGLARDGTWLVKPRASCGGAGIAPWHGQNFAQDFAPAKHHFQQRIEGLPCAAVYVAGGRDARLLGVTRQLVGEAWLHARPFAYCGSIGPLALSPALQESFRALGVQLAGCFGLRGLFGVDCILRDDQLWVIEVNPRYTASVEVLEHACGFAALALCWEVFEGGPNLPLKNCSRPLRGRPFADESAGFVGKAILFARRPLVFPADGPWLADAQALRSVGELAEFADIPEAGTAIPGGAPVLTFFTRDESVAECLARLKRIRADLDRRLHGE